MDQLKPAIEFCKKQYFWILLGLLSLMSIAGFVMTKMSLAEQLKTQQALVDSKYSSVQEVSSKASTHPNESSHQQMDAIVGVIADDVRMAWSEQYERQTRIMQWPQSLGADFVKEVEKYRPIESLAFPLTTDPLGLPFRERYRDYVDPLFPTLAKIIGANWEATVSDIVPSGGGGLGGLGGAGGSGMGPGVGPGMGPGMGAGMGPGGMNPGGMANNSGLVARPLVYWKPESQKELMQSVLWWHNKNKAPSTLEILYTQEDLWIIEGLMNIIKATNGDAQESFQATIKEIEFLRIGKSAAGRAGTLTSLGSTGNMGMGMGMGAGGSDGMMSSGGDGGDQMDMGGNIPAPSAPGSEGMGEIGEGGMVGGGAAAAPLDPASGRYVDTAFQPINGDTLRSVVSSGALNPTDAPLAVAKRVPVRMRFLMDQRKLNRLLSECGNADLLLEIRQVRINTEAFAAAAGGGMMGGMGGMMGGMGGMMGGMGGDDEGSAGLLSGAGGRGGPMGLGGLGGGEGAGTGAAGGGMIVGSAKSYDLPVEIYGIVYLFNPVDMNKLGIEKVTADTQIENVGRVSAEESTGLETDRPATVDPGVSTPAGPATPAGEAGAPAAPATPENGGGTGIAPEGSVPAPGAAGGPAAGGPASADPAAGAGAAAPPALPAAGTN